MESLNHDLQLIQKVELRFALADSNEKFQSALNLYLAPLLLKFTSNDKNVKLQLGKTVKFLLSKFNATPQLKLPVLDLLNQIKSPNIKSNEDPTIVQSYSLLFLSKAIPRLSIDEQLDIFPKLLMDISTFKISISARLFNISCKILNSLITETNDEKEKLKFLTLLSESFQQMNDVDKEFMMIKYYKFALLNPISVGSNGLIPNNIVQPGLSQDDCSFFSYYAGVTFNSTLLSDYKLNMIKLVELIQFSNFYKSLIFLIAATDGNSKVSSISSTLFKRSAIDYENEKFINLLISLFIGEGVIGPVKSQLQEKILSILCKSKIATQNGSKIDKISSIGLNSTNMKLKQSTVAFVKWFTTMNSLSDTNDETIFKIGSQLKLNLSDISADKSSPNYLDNRRYQYETLGLLLKKSNGLLDVPYIQFLFDMIKSEEKDLQPTIQDVLMELTNNLHSLDEHQKDKLKDLIIDIFDHSNERTVNDNTINIIRFISVKYINYLFPFDDPQSRIINILASSKQDKLETIEEAKKGLNPYLFKINKIDNLLPDTKAKQEFKMPLFSSMVKYILKYKDIIDFETAIIFTFRCLIMNSISDSKNTIITYDQYWETRVDKALELDQNVKTSMITELSKFTDVDNDHVESFTSSSLYSFIQLSLDYVLSSTSLNVLATLTRLISLCSSEVTDSLTSYIPSLLDNQLDLLSNESYYYTSKLTGIFATTYAVNDQSIIEILNKLVEKKSICTIGFIVSRLALRSRINIISSELFDRILFVVENGLISSSSSRSLNMSLDCISQLSMFGCLGPTLNLSPNVDSFKEKIIPKLKNLVQKSHESAIYTWCYLSLTYKTDDHLAEFTDFESILFETHTTKQIDNLFTSGEGFSILADGWKSLKMKDNNDIPNSTNSYEQFPNRCSIILDKILFASKQTKPSLRKAACIWLLSIVQYCTDEVIIERIGEIQNSFMRFLSNREEIVQEAASRGLSITYEKGGYEIQETLVHNLLKTFTDSNKTSKELMNGYVDEDTELFDAGVLNTGDGESVSTYKDVLSLANEVGNPSLVYKFMSLAKNSALWSSKKGLAFGLGAILDKEKLDKLLIENPSLSERLIPKLFRYKYDPSTSISRTMENIWNSLISDNKETLSRNFNSILNELLTGMGNKEWRIREASAAGLQDLLRQSEFSNFEDDLEKIWMMAFRSMDDIKSSVRKEGTSLTKFLANTMVMKLNSTSNKTNSETILKQLVPFFLGNNGLLSESEDVKKFAFDTIMKLISTSSKSLKPFVTEIICQMVSLMTSVEPQAINYLTLNADKYNLKVEDIDSQRLGMVGSSPMMEAIEKLMDLLDENTIETFIEQFGQSVKSAIGLPSKVTGSKIIVNLILRHFFIVNKYGDQLLKIASGQLSGKNETVARSYAIAAGYCIRIASVKKTESFGKKLIKYYFEKKVEFSNDEKLPRISSVALESISNFSNDKFNSHASLFLPLSFIGMHDLNSDISKNFRKVWDDSTSSSVNSIKLYFPEIISLIKSHIQTQIFSLRKTIALSIIEIVDKLDTKLNDLNPADLNQLYQILLDSLVGRVFEGKDKLLDSLVKLACKSHKFLANNDDLYTQLEERVLNECNRNNREYKINSIIALGNLLNTYHQNNTLYKKHLELVDGILNREDIDSDDDLDDVNKMEVDAIESKKSSLKYVILKQSLIKNVIFSINNGERINLDSLEYALNQMIQLIKFTDVDLLPNSDSKFKYKKELLSLITDLVELNKNNILNKTEKELYTDKIYEIWELSKKITGTSDNLQSIMLLFARLTGLLIGKLQMNETQRNNCIMILKVMKSDNVNSVITIECEKILSESNIR
ncbi:Ecm29 protein [Pichia kluyveri]|uniref:Ecm29 protein n=1 Tax=Pichia kluyveri TaxID=36015 RepID=A0AAV5R084_PICKL|nr:Ecm29 protein [Pichia kluyveri]